MNPIRLGILGLGRAFTLMLPTFKNDPRVKLVAAFDPREKATLDFSKEFAALAHPSPEALCSDPQVEWVYVATPHQMHVEHVALAAAHGKHVLVEKPMALSIEDCSRMIDACKNAGTQMIIGHSHSFNSPVLLARRMISSGVYGQVRMIHAMNFTDFLYRARRPEELNTGQGGGVVFSQAAHQVDIVRLLAGGVVTAVNARTGSWDSSRPTEGAYFAMLDFANGVTANLTYNGYGYYDSDVLMDSIGEMGKPKMPDAHQTTRRSLLAATNELAEAQLKAERNYGGRDYRADAYVSPNAYQHFGPVIVSCDRADLRVTPYGVEIHDAAGVHLSKIPAPSFPRLEVIDELFAVGRNGFEPLHGGGWSRATMEVCLAILDAAHSKNAMITHYQQAPSDSLLKCVPNIQTFSSS